MSDARKVIIAGDHYAIDLVSKIENYLKGKRIAYKNVGSKTSEEKLALQEMIPRVAEKIADGVSGILVCGTGVGVEVGANRFKGIRASLCTNAETAKYARQYDDANVLCLSSWQTASPDEILEEWLATDYDGNAKRLEMFKAFDGWAK